MIVLLLLAGSALAGQACTLRASPEEAQALLDAAVEASTAAFPLWVRPLVRRELAKVPTTCATYAFRMEADEVAWRCDGQRELVVPRAMLGQTFELRHKGKRHPTTVTVQGPTLTARFAGDDGWREDVFRFGADGALELTATVGSDQLTVPLTWTLPYACTPTDG